MASNLVKAIRIEQHGGPEVLKLVEVEVPPPAANEVTIDQHAAGLNFIDIYFRTGLYPHPLPHGLGFEGAGVVTAVGADVKHLKKGDRVAYGQSPIGAYAKARNVPANQVVKVPKGIGFDEAAALMLKGLTVQYLFRQTYRLQGGETILFHAAAGGVGLIACQWAKAMGLRLIGTAGSDEKCQLALDHGAAFAINYQKEDFVERVKQITGGQNLKVVYDSVGKDTFVRSLDCLRPFGLAANFGNASGKVPPIEMGMLAAKGSLYVTRPTLFTHIASRESTQAMADDLFSMVTSGAVKIRIDQRYALKDAAQAHRDLEARKTTGCSVLLP